MGINTLLNVIGNYKKSFLPRSLRVLNIVTSLSLANSIVITILGGLILQDGKQKYTDLIVGNITWVNFYKSFDYIIVYLFFTVFLTSWLFLTVWFNRISSVDSTNNANEPNKPNNIILNIVLGCLSFSLTLYVILPKNLFPSIEFIITSLVATIGFIYYLKIEVKSKDFAELSKKFGFVCIAVLFVYFSVIALLVVINNRFPFFFLSHGYLVKIIAHLIMIMGAVVLIYVLFNYDKISNNFLVKIMLGTQVLIPLLLIILANGYYNRNGELLGNNIPVTTKIFILIISFCLVLYNLQAFIRFKEHETFPLFNNLILWPSVVSISGFLAYDVPPFNAFVRDDFHLGELILPWQQIVEFGQEMYSGFVSVQGLMGVLYGGINKLLFEGTASSFPLAYNFFGVAVACISAFFLCRLVGNAWGLVFSFVLLPSSDRLFMLLPVLFILAHKKLIAHPIKWLFIWLCLSIIHILYNPSIGLALFVAFMPIAGLMISKISFQSSIKKFWLDHWKSILFAIGSIGLGLIILTPIMIKILTFIRDNGSANTVAYGIGLLQYNNIPDWFPHWTPWKGINKLVWETFRTGGWVLGSLVLWYLFLRNLIQKNGQVKNTALTPEGIISLVGLVFLILLIPYSMGRIDPPALSRPGHASMLTIGTFLPLVLIMRNDFRQNAVLTVAIIGVLLGLRMSLNYQSPGQWLYRAVEKIPVPTEAIYIEGDKIGLPKLGKGFILPEKLNEIQTLKKITDKFLQEGETYFDLTNRSVLYFALDKKVPSLYSADYLAANYEIQQKMLKAIEKEKPPLVWLGPSIRHDGGPASLRTYRVYRWLVKQDYVYYESEGFQFLVRRDRYNELKMPRLSEADTLAGLSKVFHLNDLQSIPLAWGQNMTFLNPRFKMGKFSLVQSTTNNINLKENGWARVNGSDPYITWDLKQYLIGSEYDYAEITIKFKEHNNNQFRGQVFWAEPKENFSEEKSFRFNVKEGTILIPLGSNPYWLKSRRIGKFRFDIDNYDGEFMINSITFLKLIK